MILATFGVAFFSSGTLLAINSIIGDSKIRFTEGVVVDRRHTGGKGTIYLLSVSPVGEAKILELQVNSEEYDLFEVGSPYTETWYTGSLGLIYK